MENKKIDEKQIELPVMDDSPMSPKQIFEMFNSIPDDLQIIEKKESHSE